MNSNKPANTKFRRALGVAFASVLLVATASGQTLIDDDFAGTTVNTATWHPYAGSATIVVNNGVTLTTNPIPEGSPGGNGNRVNFISKATNINPFAEALTFTFSGLTLTGGTGTNAGWGNTFFASVGRVGADTGAAFVDNTIPATYYPTGGISSNFYEGALGLNIRTNDGVITLSLYDRGATLGTTHYTLDAMPTDVVWTIDGTGTTATWSVSLTGATIEGAEGGSSVSGTFSNFNAEDLIVGDESVSRLAFGAYTLGNMDTNTVVTLDGVSVGVIPEPSAYALIFAGLAGAVVMVRRR